MNLPYAHLNLRFNPFGEATPRERAALAVVDTTPWLERLRRPRWALQLVGDSGRGKSTHLLAIAGAIDGAGFVRVPEDGRVTWPGAPVVLVDEIQHAPRRHRARLFRRGLPLALGTHLDVADELSRFGYEVQTVRLDRVPETTLVELCRRRVEWARRRPGPVPRVTSKTARMLIARHGDDVRAMESELYERFQNLTEPCDVVM